ncbi:hypothetical protein R1sor_022662 [Riccia sorocarpa]|uniref:Protein cereblon n=1 Tax=Riccia sorocarpa TaxID=122646 RepID=A0ABD3GPC6_9MARC
MNGGETSEPPDDVRDQGTVEEASELPAFTAGTENNTDGGVSTAEPQLEESRAGRDGAERREEGIRRAQGAERMQMQRIRELDSEQLEVEEVDSDADNLQSDDDSSEDGARGDGGAGSRGGFTFDTTLVSQHTYLGEVDDIPQARSFLSGGDILTLPMFYLEGTILFPDDTLPLRVVQPRFKAAVERAMRQTEAPCTIGVIHRRARMRGSGVPMLSVGTTAEIRQLSRLTDGSMNVVTRGRQRFRLRKAWTEPDGAPCAQVQIIEEDTPLHIPRDAFGSLAAVPSLQSGRVPRSAGADTQDGSDEEGAHQVSSEGDYFDDESDSGDEDRGFPFGLFGGDHVQWQREENRGGGEDESSEEEERLRWWWRLRRDGRNRRRREPRRETRTPRDGPPQGIVESSPEPMDQGETSGTSNGAGPSNKKLKLDGAWGGACKVWAADEKKWLRRAQRTAWPHWVYRMYDAYDLARRAADMLRQFVDLPKLDELIRDPAALSFFIAKNTPLQDSTRQELLEVDGVVHRLRREIQLLESLDRLRCKICMAVIARRSDVILMSTEGAISTLVNPGGYVHETLTLSRAWGLMLRGRPDTAHSWFPGYAWTIAHCSQCELHMGWRFTAVKKGLRPKAFWGVRRSQLAENAEVKACELIATYKV